jgi:hypothetical protein
MIPSSEGDALYSAWVEGEWGNSYYHVKRYDVAGGTWQALGGQINARKAPQSQSVIKLGQYGAPYLYFYEDNGTYDRGHQVKTWDGTSWNTIYSDTLFGPGDYDMDINFYPTIVYKQGSNTFHFQSYDGANWNENFTMIDQHHEVYTPTLMLRGHDPYLVYYYNTGYTHSLVRDYNGTDWVSLGALESNTSIRQALCASSVIDGGSNLVVAYVEKNNPNQSKYGPNIFIKRYDGHSWSTIGTAINGSTSVSIAGGLEGGGGPNRCLSLAYDAPGNDLYLAWMHEEGGKKTIRVSRYDGSNWVPAAPQLADDQSIKRPSLVIDGNGRLNVSVLYDSTPNHTDHDDIRVYRCDQDEDGGGGD